MSTEGTLLYHFFYETGSSAIIVGYGLLYLDPSLASTVYKQGGHFIIPLLLWQVFAGSSERLPNAVVFITSEVYFLENVLTLIAMARSASAFASHAEG